MKARSRTRAGQTVQAIGQALVVAGVLLLLFVAYELWGTGLRTAQAQTRLNEDLSRAMVAVTAPLSPAAPDSDDRSAAAPEPSSAPTAPRLDISTLPETGMAAGRIEVPAIGLDWVFVQGVSVENLEEGPGHYPDTPMPGQAGNAAIAGHRTTYGAPFNRIDEVELGDAIIVATIQGRFQYTMSEQLIVAPSQIEVLAPIAGRNVLTLTSCHPKYSALQRIIVRADLASDPLPAVISPSTPSQSGPTVPIHPASILHPAASRCQARRLSVGLRWRGAGPPQ